ncbi:MAG: hypothetical protein J4F38_11155 [Pseudomonadales bacterium]|nr:hypothetical protein [Pseudomonadales bacterium]
MPRQLLLFCVAVALAELAHAVETNGIDFDDIDDPLAEQPVFLQIDRAFAFSSRLHVGEGGTEEIIARWDMPEGYYLYRQGFGADAERGLTLGELTIPPGEMRTDEYFGESEVYLGRVEVVAPVLSRSAESATVRFSYQGCAERGFCYPPAERTVTFRFAQVPPVRWQGGILAAGGVLLLAALWAVRAIRSRRAVR